MAKFHCLIAFTSWDIDYIGIAIIWETGFENGKSLYSDIKSIFIIFKGISVAKNCIKHESAPLIQKSEKSRIKFAILVNW